MYIMDRLKAYPMVETMHATSRIPRVHVRTGIVSYESLYFTILFIVNDVSGVAKLGNIRYTVCGPVAQWQSIGLLIRRSWVRSPPGSPFCIFVVFMIATLTSYPLSPIPYSPLAQCSRLV